MVERIPAPQNISPTTPKEKIYSNELNVEQLDEQQDFQEMCEGAFNPAAVRRSFKSLEQQKMSRKETLKSEEKKVAVVEDIKKIDETAGRFQKQNYELQKKSLLLLRENISESDTFLDILKKVLSFYPDKSLADEALDFIIETTKGSLREEAIKAKELLNKEYSREVAAGRNIKAEAQEYAKTGVGTATSLRDFYRYVIDKQRDAQALFNEIFKNYNFNDIKTLIKFLFHSLGADLRSKGPSISRAELLKLVDDTKSMQAILGVYRFFYSRMNLINSQFKKYDLLLPSILDFETLTRAFLKILGERYVSAEKLYQLAKLLSLTEELAQMIILTQMRDATRNTSLKLYSSSKQRQDLLDAIMDALEELEEKIEGSEEEAQEEKVNKKKTKGKKNDEPI